MKKNLFVLFFVCLIIFVFVDPGFSASTGMPWESKLDVLLSSLSGPVAKVIGALSIVFLGLGLAFSEGGSVAKKALWVVMGLSITFNATSWGVSFLGYGGALLI